jgi:hypothetical protein
VALITNALSEEFIASIFKVAKISELGFLQELHGVTSQKTSFFIVTAVKSSNLTIDNKNTVYIFF